MSGTISDISVDNTVWVDLNTESSIAVGTKMSITNKSDSWCRLYEGDTAPDIDSKDGEILTNLNKNSGRAIIPTGSLKIWALSVTSFSVSLSVQEL